MDDLKGVQSESSIHSSKRQMNEDSFAGMPSGLDSSENRVDQTNSRVANIWDNLEQGLGDELDSSEFGGGVDTPYDDDDSKDFGTPIEDGVPEGWEGVPASERIYNAPSAEEQRYQGPSLDARYQSRDELEAPPIPTPKKKNKAASAEALLDESTRPVGMASGESPEDRTISIPLENQTNAPSAHTGSMSSDKTIAVEGFANARMGKRKSQEVDVKVSVGHFRGSNRAGAANVFTSVDASLAQAENLKIAQQRILELEKEVEALRSENEELASAGDIIRIRADELAIRIGATEKDRQEDRESAQSEMLVLKGSLQFKENEAAKARLKVEELETRLRSDFKKIRVRERELENRLELLRAEKAALVRSKDEYILEQKRKVDQLSQELDNYRKKCLELNKALDANQDQFKRTERALRLALSNLEVNEENLIPLKKAE